MIQSRRNRVREGTSLRLAVFHRPGLGHGNEGFRVLEKEWQLIWDASK